MHKKRFSVPIGLLKAIIHVGCLAPLIIIYWLALGDELGADPVEEVIHFTGIGALNIFLLSLLVSPTAKYFKQGKLIQVRRVIGLYAFVYALCHLLNFLFFEVQFDLVLFFDEIIERPYITIGMTAFVILSLLAITSISRFKKRMGTKWQTLHNYSYLAGIAIVVHFYWSVKSELIEPLIYIGLLFILLFFRKDKFVRWFK
jgi:sulfoxide reductase heme-binding subunit YedZ